VRYNPLVNTRVTSDRIIGRIFFRREDLLSLIGDFFCSLMKNSENATITVKNNSTDMLISDGILKLFITITVKPGVCV
jgi:hypothetical protein